MNVLMLGWEFPPYISGGLGTACYGLTRGLDRTGVSVVFVLPTPVETVLASHVRILAPSPALRAEVAAGDVNFTQLIPGPEFRRTTLHAVPAQLSPYAAPDRGVIETSETLRGPAGVVTGVVPGGAAGSGTAAGAIADASGPIIGGGPGAHYGGDLFSEVERYARAVCRLASQATFDLIHVHDWMTFPAGMALRGLSGKPLIAHVHSTEFDRSGIHVNQRIYDIERAGMHAASRIICVSHLTRRVVVQRYGVDPRRVDVVYNAIDDDADAKGTDIPAIRRDEKIVLFLGRITMQKGPEYFLSAARRVLEVMENVRFVMAGSGDMIRFVIEMAAGMGIGHKVLFTGFLRGADVRRIFRMADLYVMPSVSEPFGITPLEALSNDVPVLISKQSGVAEVLTHALKVDFWDVDEMANKIVGVLRHPPLQATLRDHGRIEVRRFSWKDSATQIVDVYRKALGGSRN